ncbi:protein PIGBOS1 isoform X1 [Xyrichtys novacula]|uniref:Protein PIGBOS1 isoform X1 n=1 Tax=Xyrichtys novacula TaxID=13765 RepID=A0AAV1EKJ3_XYRNO|nr:protein PIGBOS1 isoform X1 [Xyrichtys novacula]
MSSCSVFEVIKETLTKAASLDLLVSYQWHFTLTEDMFRRRIPFTQMAFATLLGVAGGVYIYRPFFEPLLKSPGQENQDKPKKHEQAD